MKRLIRFIEIVTILAVTLMFFSGCGKTENNDNNVAENEIKNSNENNISQNEANSNLNNNDQEKATKSQLGNFVVSNENLYYWKLSEESRSKTGVLGEFNIVPGAKIFNSENNNKNE